jgi:hypothetical protein
MPKNYAPEPAFPPISPEAPRPFCLTLRQFENRPRHAMLPGMDKTARRYTVLPLALIALGLGVMAATAAFAGWLEHGTAIFLSLAESGMSWCF